MVDFSEHIYELNASDKCYGASARGLKDKPQCVKDHQRCLMTFVGKSIGKWNDKNIELCDTGVAITVSMCTIGHHIPYADMIVDMKHMKQTIVCVTT